MASRDDQDIDTGCEEWSFDTGGRLSLGMVVDETVYVSGDQNLYAVDVCTGAERWAFEVEDSTRVFPKKVAHGIVYAYDYDNLYAIDTATGTEKWAFDMPCEHLSRPVVGDEMVYVTNGDFDFDDSGNNLYAIDMATGTEVWSSGLTNVYTMCIPTVSDGTVYIQDDSLYAINATTGGEKWSFDVEGMSEPSPIVIDGTVYIKTPNGNLYGVDETTGTEEWFFEAGYHDVSFLILMDEGTYTVSDGPNLYAVDAATGTEEWSFEVGDVEDHSTVSKVVDGTVYVSSNENNLYAVDAATGTVDWSFDISDWAFDTRSNLRSYTNLTVDYGTVYIVSPAHHTEHGIPTNKLYAVDAATGTVDWSFEAENDIITNPIVGDGRIYIGSKEQNLYAICVSKRPDCDRVSPSEGLFQQHLGNIETGAEQIPDLNTARSPERCSLSHEDFQAIEDIGQGGQAEIKKARLPDSKTSPMVVAIREPRASGTLTTEACEEFLNRGKKWQTIDDRERNKQRWENYEHIVGVIDTGNTPFPWIAMEYMDGGNLEELLETSPDGLPVNQALWTGECICKGLEIAEKLGMCHLDVKPENVLLKETAGWPWPKLADWGLARTLADETGTIDAMSPQYAAPEQFDSSTFGDPNQLTDIYQTGALLYAVLTGNPPVTGSYTEVIGTVLSGESMSAPSERRPELPPVVDAAVGLAVERQKADRYDSITDFRKALNAIRTDETLPREVARRVEE